MEDFFGALESSLEELVVLLLGVGQAVLVHTQGGMLVPVLVALLTFHYVEEISYDKVEVLV